MENEHEKLMTRQDVARLAQVSVRTVDEHVARGKLRPIKIGRAVRFKRAEISRWLNTQESGVTDAE